MRKYLIIVVCLLMLVTGCMSKGENSLVKKELSEGLILRYQENEIGDSESIYQICVYSDMYITYGISNLKDTLRVELTETEYQEIVNYIESDLFLNLDNDLSILDEEGKMYSKIVVYYNNYTDFAVGGTNVKNETYLELVEMLKSFKK